MSKFPFYKQPDNKDCGPTCLKIVSKFFKRNISVQQLRRLSETTRSGSSLLELGNAAEKIGFRSLGAKISLDELIEVPLPCILHWNNNHYVVLYRIKSPTPSFLKRSIFKKGATFFVSDPAHGLIKYSQEEFLKHWIGNNATENTEEGIVLLLETTPKFYTNKFDTENKEFGFSFLFNYILKYHFHPKVFQK